MGINAAIPQREYHQTLATRAKLDRFSFSGAAVPGENNLFLQRLAQELTGSPEITQSIEFIFDAMKSFLLIQLKCQQKVRQDVPVFISSLPHIDYAWRMAMLHTSQYQTLKLLTLKHESQNLNENLKMHEGFDLDIRGDDEYVRKLQEIEDINTEIGQWRVNEDSSVQVNSQDKFNQRQQLIEEKNKLLEDKSFFYAYDEYTFSLDIAELNGIRLKPQCWPQYDHQLFAIEHEFFVRLNGYELERLVVDFLRPLFNYNDIALSRQEFDADQLKVICQKSVEYVRRTLAPLEEVRKLKQQLESHSYDAGRVKREEFSCIDLQFQEQLFPDEFILQIIKYLHCDFDYAQCAIQEYLRFLQLHFLAKENVRLVPSEEINIIWQIAITFEKEECNYEQFCQNTAGTLVHYQFITNDDATADAYEKTLSFYEYVFSAEPPPQFWPAPADRFHPMFTKAMWVSIPRLVQTVRNCTQRTMNAVLSAYAREGLWSAWNIVKLSGSGSEKKPNPPDASDVASNPSSSVKNVRKPKEGPRPAPDDPGQPTAPQPGSSASENSHSQDAGADAADSNDSPSEDGSGDAGADDDEEEAPIF